MRRNNANDTLPGHGGPDFSNSSKTKATHKLQIRLQHIVTWWGSYGRGVSFEGFSGEHGAGEKSLNVEWPTGICAGLFSTKPRVKK